MTSPDTRSDFRVTSEVNSVGALMKKFSTVPMSLADACLVRMTELEQQSVVIEQQHRAQAARKLLFVQPADRGQAVG